MFERWSIVVEKNGSKEKKNPKCKIKYYSAGNLHLNGYK